MFTAAEPVARAVMAAASWPSLVLFGEMPAAVSTASSSLVSMSTNHAGRMLGGDWVAGFPSVGWVWLAADGRVGGVEMPEGSS